MTTNAACLQLRRRHLSCASVKSEARMVTKRVRSEYMKKFKDPKWETYAKCYEEMLKYRLTRRLLEHTHKPWFWSGSDSDSDSGDRSPPPCKNQVGVESSKHTELEECEELRKTRPEERETRSTGPQPRIPNPDKQEEDVSAPQSTVHVSGAQHDGMRETRLLQVEEKEQRAKGNKQSTQFPEKVRDFAQPQLRKSSKTTKRAQKVRPTPPRQPRKDAKESRHPFALYGSGERSADMAGRRTHNVGPAASTTEIHESALRARTRREVERQMQIQQNERRRAKSADMEKARRLVEPEFNPWLSEYMRCFSAPSR
uniref:Centriole, cilia and spindle-associated protein b n=1 Tax=Oryzias latipes TaxID=8090 RepID=A0A3P9GZV3_ORYLA